MRCSACLVYRRRTTSGSMRSSTSRTATCRWDRIGPRVRRCVVRTDRRRRIRRPADDATDVPNATRRELQRRCSLLAGLSYHDSANPLGSPRRSPTARSRTSVSARRTQRSVARVVRARGDRDTPSTPSTSSNSSIAANGIVRRHQLLVGATDGDARADARLSNRRNLASGE